MKFVQYVEGNSDSIKKGILEGEEIREIEGDIFDSWQETSRTVPLSSVRLQAPLQPKHIIGIGANYVADGEEKPEIPKIPVFFYKPLNTVVGPEDDIVLPGDLDEVKFESEIAVVIGKKAKNISKEEVADYIFGYTVANDVTAPDLFHPAGHWTIGKAADTFTPIGPHIETELDLSQVRIRSELNGEEKQNSGLDNIIVDIPTMISFLSRYVTLEPGDVILTGAPVGAVMMKAGDVIECIVDGIGTLRNTVVK